MLQDYLGWKFVSVFSMFLCVLSALAIGFFLKKKKRKITKLPLKQGIIVWGSGIILIAHLLFVWIINPIYFGLGAPASFFKIHLTDDRIILFDSYVTTYDDDNTRTDDISGHLRIHVINRTERKKEYSKLIGTNYSTISDENGLYMVENSSYNYNSADNNVKTVFQYDIESQEMAPIVSRGESIIVNGKEVNVFEIKVLTHISVKSNLGDLYYYNSSTKSFEPKDENSVVNLEPTVRFFMNTSAQSDKTSLMINNKNVDQEFLLGSIVSSKTKGSNAYVLVKWFKDLTKTESKYSLLNEKRELLWSTNLKYFEKLTGAEDLEDIQLFTFDKDKCFLTLDEYLFEMEIKTGRLNWWLKL